MTNDVDLVRIAQGQHLTYPIATKSEFVAQMSADREVVFHDVTYDTKSAADLIPGFFFPLESADDLVRKATELLISRGLAEVPSAEGPIEAPPQNLASPTDRPASHIDDVIARLERSLVAPTRAGTLARERVEALDIVSHALDFVDHPRGLLLWREALWGHHLHPETGAAIEIMTAHVRAAAARGDWNAISEICDCLEDLLDPSVDARPHIGGIRKGDAVAR